MENLPFFTGFYRSQVVQDSHHQQDYLFSKGYVSSVSERVPVTRPGHCVVVPMEKATRPSWPKFRSLTWQEMLVVA